MARHPVYTHKEDRIEEEGSPQNEYPNQKVWQTQGGIKLVYGDEKGKQFFRLIHPSGTYTEIYPDGKMTTLTVGDAKNYAKGGVTMTIDENGDIKFNGHSKFVVAGGAHIEVAGDAGVAVGGDIAMVGMKSFKMDVQDAYLGVRGNLGISVEGSTAIETKGETMIRSDGDMHIKSSGGNVNQDAGADMYLQSGKAKSKLA
jgi:hypothetical protein